MTKNGKVALLTGASSGIGQWTALGLIRKGYDVLAPVRDPDRGRELLSWLRDKGASGGIELLSLDLGSLSSVARFADEVARKTPKLDVLINNAGMFPHRRETTAEGFERTLAVNHLSPTLLALNLRPLLQAAGRARIVTVGSAASDRARIAPDLQLPDGWTPMKAYGQSKLAVMIATFSLADRFKGLGVTANVLHPGVVSTRIGDVGGGFGMVWGVLKPFLLAAEKGAETSLYVATSPNVEGVTGQYFKRSAVAKANPLARDPALQARVMEQTTTLLKPYLAEQLVL